MKALNRAVALVLCLALTSCVGYFQIGGSKNPQSVHIGPSTPRVQHPNCPPFELPTDKPLPGYPQFAGTESDDDVIDALGYEIVRLRNHHEQYVDTVQKAYSEYVRRCMER